MRRALHRFAHERIGTLGFRSSGLAPLTAATLVLTALAALRATAAYDPL